MAMNGSTATGRAQKGRAPASGDVAHHNNKLTVMHGTAGSSPGKRNAQNRQSSPSPMKSNLIAGSGASFDQPSSYSRTCQFDYTLPTISLDHHSAAYRYHKTRSAVLTRTHVPQQDTLTPVSCAPPVGTYDVPVFPAELKQFDRKPSSPFRSSGRVSQFIENSTMFYKSLRDETSLTNMGPGSYNLAYSWRTDEHNYAHLRTVSTSPGGSGSGSPHKASSPHYDRPWLVPKATAIPLSPRSQQAERWNTKQDLEAIRNLPDYP